MRKVKIYINRFKQIFNFIPGRLKFLLASCCMWLVISLIYPSAETQANVFRGGSAFGGEDILWFLPLLILAYINMWKVSRW